MKPIGLQFGENAEGALKSLFGAAKEAVGKAGSVVDSAIEKAISKDEAPKGPHIEVSESVHAETPVVMGGEVQALTPVDTEHDETGWFNVAA